VRGVKVTIREYPVQLTIRHLSSLHSKLFLSQFPGVPVQYYRARRSAKIEFCFSVASTNHCSHPKSRIQIELSVFHQTMIFAYFISFSWMCCGFHTVLQILSHIVTPIGNVRLLSNGRHFRHLWLLLCARGLVRRQKSTRLF
jgi:hypothetical protein